MERLPWHTFYFQHLCSAQTIHIVPLRPCALSLPLFCTSRAACYPGASSGKRSVTYLSLCEQSFVPVRFHNDGRMVFSLNQHITKDRRSVTNCWCVKPHHWVSEWHHAACVHLIKIWTSCTTVWNCVAINTSWKTFFLYHRHRLLLLLYFDPTCTDILKIMPVCNTLKLNYLRSVKLSIEIFFYTIQFPLSKEHNSKPPKVVKNMMC